MVKNDETLTISIIFDTLQARGTEFTPWSESSKAITDAGITVKNWMRPRGALQWMMDEGFVEREDNVHVENYRLRLRAA